MSIISSARFATAAAFAALLGAAFGAHASERIVSPATGFGQANDGFGAGAAIAGDTLAFGIPGGEPDGTERSGAIVVYRQGASGWQREAVLAPQVPVDNGGFGGSLALGQDIIVSANNRSDGSQALYDIETRERSGTTWSLTNTFSLTGVDFAGLSLSGDTLVVNVYLSGIDVYTRSGSAWTLATTLQGDQPGEVVESATIGGSHIVVIGSTGGRFDRVCFAHFFSGSGPTWNIETTIPFGDSFSATCGMASAIDGDTALIGHMEWINDTGHARVDAYVRDQGTWSLQGRLDPGTDYNGYALAIEGDRAIVGSPGDEVLGQGSAGSAYVFERSGGAWTRTEHLYDPAGGYSYEFGGAVALQGDTVLAGSPGAYTDAGRAGKASLITLGGADWTVDDSFDDGNLHATEGFGMGVAASGSTLVVGAPVAYGPGSETSGGAAYVFTKSAGTWTSGAALYSTSTRPGWFGGAIALDQSTLLVGAAQDDDGLGAVYVYGAPDWAQAARLTSSSGGQYAFGSAVAIGGAWAAVGEPGAFLQTVPPQVAGAVHLYTGSGSTWTDAGVLAPSAGHVGDEFGLSLAMSGDTLIVGAPLADDGIESEAGLAYVFVRTGSTWTEQARLEAPVPAAQAGFGVAVAIVGDTAVVGAGGVLEGFSDRGAAYAFHRSGSDWSVQATLAPAEDTTGAYGHAVAISSDEATITVGMPHTMDGSGRAFTFHRSAGDWLEGAMLQGSAGATTYDAFGLAIAFDGSDAFVGAPYDGVGGAVYGFGVGDAIFAGSFEAPP